MADRDLGASPGPGGRHVITDSPRLRRLPRFESVDAYRDSRPGRAFWMQGWVRSFGVWNSDGVAFELLYAKKTEELVLLRCGSDGVTVLARGITSKEVLDGTIAALDTAMEKTPDDTNNLAWLADWDPLGWGLGSAARSRRRGMPRSRFRRPDQLLFG